MFAGYAAAHPVPPPLGPTARSSRLRRGPSRAPRRHPRDPHLSKTYLGDPQLGTLLPGTHTWGNHLRGPQDVARGPPDGIPPSDSDWQMTHSTSGGCIRLAGGCYLAVSRKQDCATNSTAYAEIVAAYGLADDVKHAVGLCADLGLPQDTVEFEVDNKSLFDVSRNYSATKNLRHLGLRDFRIREYAFAGLLQLKLVSTHDNFADLFTKALNRTHFEQFRALVCIVFKTIR